MEENSLSHPLKYPHIGTRAIKDCVNDINVMANAELSCNRQSHGEDYVNGFSWPPRSYTCSFCRREFRSAQALGGHMNVHRRDRARLRQSPPSDGQYPVLNVNFNPNPNPNPNPNFSSSSSSPSLSSPSRRLKSFALPLPSLISPTLSSLTSPPFASPGEVKSRASVGSLLDSSRPKSMDVAEMDTEKSFHEAGDVDGFKQEDGCKNLKKTEILRLDLETCPFSDSKGDDLDLELRLGYS